MRLSSRRAQHQMDISAPTGGHVVELKNRAIVGAIWAVGGMGLGQIIRFVSNVILTRLLYPELFGMMQLVTVLLVGLTLFSDLGIAPSIVRSPRGEATAFRRTAWTMHVIRGAFLCVIVLAIASPASRIYKQPSLVAVMIACSFLPLAQGLGGTAQYVYQRRMLVRQLVIQDIVISIVATCVTVVWAMLKPSIWALVAGQLSGSFLTLVWSHLMTRDHRESLQLEKAAMKEMFHFGLWIFISTAFTYLGEHADRLVLGKLFTLKTFGVFAIAVNLSELPRQIIGSVSNRVIFPVMSEISTRPRAEMRAIITRSRKVVLYLTALGMSVLASFGDIAVGFIYDSRYAAARWMFAILLYRVWFGILMQTSDPALMAIGKPVYASIGNAGRAISNFLVLPLAFALYGISGVIVGLVIKDVLYYCVIVWGLRRESLSVFRQDVVATAIVIMTTSMLMTFRYLMGFNTPFNGMT